MSDKPPQAVVIALAKLAEAVPAAVVEATTQSGLMLLGDVKKRAARDRNLPSEAGKPPRLQTGNYNRSINKRTTTSAGRVTVTVGTNAVQGARLEYGFDAPGQRTLPHPHFRPALAEIAPVFEAAVRAAVETATRGAK